MKYHHLTEAQRAHFLEHGWLRIPNAISKRYLEEWMENLWVRLGMDKDDQSTWTEEYLKLPRHREVPVAEFCPEAWEVMRELVGDSEDRKVIDPVRESHHGDQFICLFPPPDGREPVDVPPSKLQGWHTDNDYYRAFLDSSENALTVIHCFTDIPAGGGGTMLCEDGIKDICQFFYDHPEGLDPPFGYLYEKVPHCKKYTQVEAKAGDVLITHALLPHSSTVNHLKYARVITNPHVNLHVPYNFSRADGDYSLCEQVILQALGRDSIPEYKPTRSRQIYYPRTAAFKRARVPEELARMIADAERKGLGPEAVDSFYLRGEQELREHEKRNGYDRAEGPGGVALSMDDPSGRQLERLARQKLVNHVD